MTRSPVLNRLAWGVGLLPCALAAFFQFVAPPQPRAFEIPSRPALAFDQYCVDLGRISQSPETRATFVFRNRSSQTVHIDDVHPSCGCLEPQLSSRDIEPRQLGRIVLRMQSASESPGRKEFFADVKYTDPEPRAVRLTFKLELPDEGLTVRPRALLVYQNNSQPTRNQLVVTDTRAEPAQVLDVDVNKPLVEVAVGERRVNAFGKVEQTVDVLVPGEVPRGSHDAIVTIHTDDPDLPVIRVPVRIVNQPAADPPHEL